MSDQDSPLFTWRGAVCDCQSLKSTTKHVLLTIATHMNGRGEGSYPTTRQLAYETGLSERTVCTHIELARQAGWVTTVEHGFRGKKWANHEYVPTVPKDQKRVTWTQFRAAKKDQLATKNNSDSGSEIEEKIPQSDAEGTEGGSVASCKKGTEPDAKALNLTTEGTEPDDTKALNLTQKALKEVQCSSSYSTHSSTHNSINPPNPPEGGEGEKRQTHLTTPEQQFENPDNHPAYQTVAIAWRRHGNGEVKPRDLALFCKHVSEHGFELQFLIGAQNYLNDKSTQPGARYKNLDTFIRNESWLSDPEVKSGPIHLDGAPSPSSVTPGQETVEDRAQRLSDEYLADLSILEGELS